VRDEPVPSAASGHRTVQAAQTFLVRVVTYGLGFMVAVLIARTLGPTGRGAYYILVTVSVTAVALGHVSVEQANLYLWSRWTDRRQLAGASFLAALVLGFIVAGVAGVVILGPARAAVPLENPGLLWIALVGVPVQLAGLYGAGLLVAGGWLRANNLSLLASTVFHLGVIGALALNGWLDVRGVMVAWLVAALLVALLQWRGVLAHLGFRPPSRALLRRVASIGLRYHLGMVALYLILRVDIFMLNALTNITQVGLYSIAVTLAEATFLLTDSVGQAAVARQIETGGAEHHYTARITRTNFALSLLAVTVLTLAAPLAVPFVFGEEFRSTVGPLISLAPGIVAFATLRPLAVFGNQANQPGTITIAYLLSLLLNIALNATLIPILGIVGAGVASSVTYIGLAAFYCAWFLRVSELSPAELRPRFDDLAAPAVLLARSVTRRR
jgi:O-antigen/teichoic acid export membrane protein